MNIKKILTLSAFALTSLLLTGCTLFEPVTLTPIQIYTLRNSSAAHFVAKTPRSHETLFVMQPGVAAAYRSDKLLNLTEDQELQPFRDSAWVAPPSQLILPLLVERLQNSGYFHAVVAPPFVGLSDFRLETTVLAFDRRQKDNSLVAEVGLQALLVSSKTNRVLASQNFFANELVANKSSRAFVSAINSAVNRVLTEVVTFLGQQVKNFKDQG